MTKYALKYETENNLAFEVWSGVITLFTFRNVSKFESPLSLILTDV